MARPFRIYISLLDKWEIGGALTDVLVYDALSAIKELVESAEDGNEEVRLMIPLQGPTADCFP